MSVLNLTGTLGSTESSCRLCDSDSMVDTSRALRRAHDRRVKARTRRVMRLWFGNRFPENPRKVGVNASTHSRPCACSMCQADRRDIPPLRERAFDYPELP